MFYYIRRVVNEFQDANTGTAKRHYNDLKYTSMVLYNVMVKALRNGVLVNTSLVDVVLETSKVIEETTLMREQMRGDENTYKGEIVDFYYNSEQEFRKPNQVNSFVAFRNKKSNKVKDYAVEIVTKMYRLDYTDRKEVAAEIKSKLK